MEKNKLISSKLESLSEIEMELELIKKKYPNAKVSYYFAKNPNGKNYVVQAKENGKIVYSSYQYPNVGGVEHIMKWWIA